MRMAFHAGSDIGSEIKSLDGGGGMWAPFQATFTDEKRVKITLVLDVVDGAPSCRSYKVERIDGKGLEYMTTDIMRGLSLRNLMYYACAQAALTSDDGVGYTTAVSTAAIETVVAPLRRRRQPITDGVLRRFADEYRGHFEPGRMEELAESLAGYSERQGWRLLKLGVERGVLVHTKGRRSWQALSGAATVGGPAGGIPTAGH